jgi:hypothetical protein
MGMVLSTSSITANILNTTPEHVKSQPGELSSLPIAEPPGQPIFKPGAASHDDPSPQSNPPSRPGRVTRFLPEDELWGVLFG